MLKKREKKGKKLSIKWNCQCSQRKRGKTLNEMHLHFIWEFGPYDYGYKKQKERGYLRAILVYIECSVKINYEIVDTPHVHAQRFFNMAIIQQEQI